MDICALIVINNSENGMKLLKVSSKSLDDRINTSPLSIEVFAWKGGNKVDNCDTY